MNSKSCLLERLFSVGAGSALLAIGALIAVFGLITLPFIGLIIALPVLLGAAALIAGALRAECPI
jgi:hypothetical protein